MGQNLALLLWMITWILHCHNNLFNQEGNVHEGIRRSVSHSQGTSIKIQNKNILKYSNYKWLMFPVEKHNQQIQELCIALIFLWETTPACGSGLVDLITKSQSWVWDLALANECSFHPWSWWLVLEWELKASLQSYLATVGRMTHSLLWYFSADTK